MSLNSYLLTLRCIFVLCEKEIYPKKLVFIKKHSKLPFILPHYAVFTCNFIQLHMKFHHYIVCKFIFVDVAKEIMINAIDLQKNQTTSLNFLLHAFRRQKMFMVSTNHYVRNPYQIYISI